MLLIQIYKNINNNSTLSTHLIEKLVNANNTRPSYSALHQIRNANKDTEALFLPPKHVSKDLRYVKSVSLTKGEQERVSQHILASQKLIVNQTYA